MTNRKETQLNRIATAAIVGGAGIGLMFGLGACGSQPQHKAAPHKDPKPQACEVQVDAQGNQYCRVIRPPKSEGNPTPDPLIWYYIFMMNDGSSQPARAGGSVPLGSSGGTWQRSAIPPSGLTSLPVPTSVRIDAKGEPEEDAEAVKTVEEAEQAGEEVVDEQTDASDASEAIDPVESAGAEGSDGQSDGSGSDNSGSSGSDSSGGGDVGSSGGDAGGGDGGGGGGDAG